MGLREGRKSNKLFYTSYNLSNEENTQVYTSDYRGK